MDMDFERFLQEQRENSEHGVAFEIINGVPTKLELKGTPSHILADLAEAVSLIYAAMLKAKKEVAEEFKRGFISSMNDETFLNALIFNDELVKSMHTMAFGDKGKNVCVSIDKKKAEKQLKEMENEDEGE